MRDSLLRVIDDLVTKKNNSVVKMPTVAHSQISVGYWNGIYDAYDYAIAELRKVADDHANTPNKRTTANTE